jgi:hypothetical protein
MSQEKKDERNRKRREAYKRTREQRLHVEANNGCLIEMLVNYNIKIAIDVSHMCYINW